MYICTRTIYAPMVTWYAGGDKAHGLVTMSCNMPGVVFNNTGIWSSGGFNMTVYKYANSTWAGGPYVWSNNAYYTCYSGGFTWYWWTSSTGTGTISATGLAIVFPDNTRDGWIPCRNV